MIDFRRASIVLFVCAIPGFSTADLSSAEAQHAPPFHSVPFHPPVVHAPPLHITPLHVEPVHVTPIHSEPVHASPVHSDAMSSHVTTPHLAVAPHASIATSLHAAPSARPTSSVGIGSFSHHGSGGSGGGWMGGGGKNASLTHTFNKASVTSVHRSSAAATDFKAHTSSTFSRRSNGLQYRGERSLTGQRTIQHHVEKAVAKGNPTVSRNGQELARFREDGHGMNTASVQPRNVRNVKPNGNAKLQAGPNRLVSKRDVKELYKAQTRQHGMSLRTKGGR